MGALSVRSGCYRYIYLLKFGMVSIHLVPASLEQVSAVCGYQAKYLNDLKDTVWQLGTMVSILASEPCCPRFNYQHSKKNYDVKIVDVAEVDQEESGQ